HAPATELSHVVFLRARYPAGRSPRPSRVAPQARRGPCWPPDGEDGHGGDGLRSWTTPSAWSPMVRPCTLRLGESSVFAVTSIGPGRQLSHDPTVAHNVERMHSLEV